MRSHTGQPARTLPSIAGAVVFGTSSFVSAHLLGHFNLIAAWIVPLGMSARLAGGRSRSLVSGGSAGLAVAAAAYIDYYLLVYSVGLVGLCAISRRVVLSVRRGRRLPVSDGARSRR